MLMLACTFKEVTLKFQPLKQACLKWKEINKILKILKKKELASGWPNIPPPPHPHPPLLPPPTPGPPCGLLAFPAVGRPGSRHRPTCSRSLLGLCWALTMSEKVSMFSMLWNHLQITGIALCHSWDRFYFINFINNYWPIQLLYIFEPIVLLYIFLNDLFYQGSKIYCYKAAHSFLIIKYLSTLIITGLL